MRATLAAAAIVATTIGCGSSDNAAVCRKDAERWGQCVADLVSKDFAGEVQRDLESKIWKCAHDPDEVAIARTCATAVDCDAWMACWARKGQPER